MRRFTILPVLLLVLGGCIHNPAAPSSSTPAVIELGEVLGGDNEARVHQVHVDRERLMAITEPARVAGFLRLPDDRLLDFEVRELEGEPPRVWRGRLHEQDEAGGSLTLSRSGERLSARFQWEGQTYSLRTRDGSQVLLRHSETDRPAHSDPRLPETD